MSVPQGGKSDIPCSGISKSDLPSPPAALSWPIINAMNRTGSIACRKSTVSDTYRACARYFGPGKPVRPCSYSASLAAGQYL